MTLLQFLGYWGNLTWREHVRHVAFFLATAGLLVVIGPFGTGDQPIVWRLGYWFCMLAIYGGILMPAAAKSAIHNNDLVKIGLITKSFIILVLSVVPMTIIVHLVDRLASANIGFFARGITEVDPIPPFLPMDFLQLYVQVLTITLLSMGLLSLYIILRHMHRAGPVAFDVRPGVAFLSRLPDHIGENLVCLQMEDHYLRATTLQGEALVLVRFRDALNELTEYAGLQVHRSWWVATQEIVKFSRKGRRTELLMSNGARIPVSSSFKPLVEQLLIESRA